MPPNVCQKRLRRVRVRVRVQRPAGTRTVYLTSWTLLARGSNETAIEKRSSRPYVSVKPGSQSFVRDTAVARTVLAGLESAC